MLTGEVQNLLLSLAFVLPAVLYYRRHRTKKGAIVGLVLGSVCKIIVGVFTNLYIIFPFYIKLYGMDWDGIVAMCSAVNPWITNVPRAVFTTTAFSSKLTTSAAPVMVSFFRSLSERLWDTIPPSAIPIPP